MMLEETTAGANRLRAVATPTAAIAQGPAAVVSPLGVLLASLKIMPGPINPSPVAIAANILVIADLSSVR